jgi:hypothetical protein
LIEAIAVPCTWATSEIGDPPAFGVSVTVTEPTTEPGGVIEAVTETAIPGAASAGFTPTSKIFCAFKGVDPSAPKAIRSNPKNNRLRVTARWEGLVVSKGVAGIIIFNYLLLQQNLFELEGLGAPFEASRKMNNPCLWG